MDITISFDYINTQSLLILRNIIQLCLCNTHLCQMRVNSIRLLFNSLAEFKTRTRLNCINQFRSHGLFILKLW